MIKKQKALRFMSPVRIMYTMVTTLTHLMIQHSNANKNFTFKMANT